MTNYHLQNMPIITNEIIKKGFTYTAFRDLTDELLTNGKTTGTNHSEEMIAYTKMNVHRMERLDKKPELSVELVAALNSLQSPQIWLVIAEAWCGDVAQNLPVIARMAALNENIDVKIILRDKNLEIMDAYRYNGTLSIPRIIALGAKNLKEIWVWGPRPSPCQLLMESMKNNPEISVEERAGHIHKWYAHDRTITLQKEFLGLISGS